MNTIKANLVSHEGSDECEFVELGTVSEETKGGFWGHSDGGIGQCWC